MSIRPLTGQVLIRLLPPDPMSPGGLFLPDSAFDTPRGEKAVARKGLVIQVGPWRKTKKGLAVLPDFQPGQTVLMSHYLGHQLTRTIGENLRLCDVDDVLAVLDEPKGE
jgi:chaperonin GroES